MKKTIIKSELLRFAKILKWDEAVKALQIMKEGVQYEIIEGRRERELDSNCIYLKLRDPIYIYSIYFPVYLPSELFQLDTLFEELTKDPMTDVLKMHIDGLKMTPICQWPSTATVNLNSIVSIQYNEKKRITTVVFGDGDVQMAKLGADDEYDPCIGVAICIAAHKFGSKTAFKKYVNQNLKVKGAKK